MRLSQGVSPIMSRNKTMPEEKDTTLTNFLAPPAAFLQALEGGPRLGSRGRGNLLLHRGTNMCSILVVMLMLIVCTAANELVGSEGRGKDVMVSTIDLV